MGQRLVQIPLRAKMVGARPFDVGEEFGVAFLVRFITRRVPPDCRTTAPGSDDADQVVGPRSQESRSAWKYDSARR